MYGPVHVPMIGQDYRIKLTCEGGPAYGKSYLVFRPTAALLVYLAMKLPQARHVARPIAPSPGQNFQMSDTG